MMFDEVVGKVHDEAREEEVRSRLRNVEAAGT
ncbi:hypothetical protein ANRL4_04589 [Anaerolineae bacterium]|nr:hypothetical protein ANRL4_04589 [Anaerolineae bacterium]